MMFLLYIGSLMYTGNVYPELWKDLFQVVSQKQNALFSLTVTVCPRPSEVKKLGLFGRCFLLFCQLSQQQVFIILGRLGGHRNYRAGRIAHAQIAEKESNLLGIPPHPFYSACPRGCHQSVTLCTGFNPWFWLQCSGS